MELVTLVGYYNLLAQLMETFDVGRPRRRALAVLTDCPFSHS